MLKLNRGDQAKQCFMEALALDVKCYDAFEQLISGEMMTPDEGTNLSSLSKHITQFRRMGIHSGSIIRPASTPGFRIRAANIYCTPTKI